MTLPPIQDRFRGLTITQLVLSVIGLLGSLTSLLFIVALLIIPDEAMLPEERSQLVNIVWVNTLAILILLGSFLSSLRRLKKKNDRQLNKWRLLWISLALGLALVLSIFVFHLDNVNEYSAWLNFLAILLVILPLLWLFEVGRIQLSVMSSIRTWGLSGFTTFITLPVILIIELFFIVLMMLFGMLWLLQQPEFSTFFQSFDANTLQDPSAWESLSPQINYLLPLLEKPEVIGAMLFAIVLVIPLIEEVFKPLAVWVLIKFDLTPAEGFLAGLICGAAFALMESAFSLGAVQGGEWVFTLTGRAGTGLLHMVTTGISGWALAATWRDGKYLRIASAFFVSISLHAVWNLFAVQMGLAQVSDDMTGLTLPPMAFSAHWVLLGLGGVLFIFLLGFNRYLVTQNRISSSVSEIPPPIPFRAISGME